MLSRALPVKGRNLAEVDVALIVMENHLERFWSCLICIDASDELNSMDIQRLISLRIDLRVLRPAKRQISEETI